MTRVIHTGDTHLGYRQYHAPQRRDDFLAAFDQVIDDAIEENVDAVVHAGDLFHDRRPDLGDLLGTLSLLRRLAAADIPFLAIVGNHEHTRNHQWIELFETLGLATHLDDEGVTIGETTFYGLDHVPRSKRDDLEYQFAPQETSHAALVAHGLFTPFSHGDWNTETILTETNLDLDAMLLGDNHTPDTAKVADTWVTYCGSTERASAAERDPRGYNIVEFGADAGAESADEGVTITRRGLDTRDFVFIDLELGAQEGLDRVRERVREEDVEDAVVIVTLDGDGDGIAPASIEEFASERGALVARVNDHREIDVESPDYGVSFADPDDAVRDRVRELGLSSAARDIDETVRASKTADSNVREVVEDRIADLLENEPEAFSPASEEPETETETLADRMAADGAAEADTSSAAEERTAAEAEANAAEEVTAAAEADDTDESIAEEERADEGDADEATDPEGSPGSSAIGSTDAANQSSMEEYL